MSTTQNYCVKFAERPGADGEPQSKHFKYTECDFPTLIDGENFDVSFFISRENRGSIFK